MENNSNQNQNRRRNNRSGGGNRNRQGGNNRNRSGNRNRNRSRRRPEPKPTAMEKFLHTISFGLLGKTSKKKGKPQQRSNSQRTNSPSSNSQAQKKPAAPRKKRTPTEVTSGRLYVGNLSYDADEPEIEELFKGAGNVLSAEVVTNARTQQSKGFAFVEMGSIEEAKRAVEILDDEDFMGRKLIVSGARSEGPREGDSDEEPAMAESGADSQA